MGKDFFKNQPIFVDLIRQISKYKNIDFAVAVNLNRLDKCKYKWCMYDSV